MAVGYSHGDAANALGVTREALVRVRDEMRVPIVYVTHMPEEVYAIADVAVLISNGRMGVVGHPRTVLESPSETSGP